MARVKVSELFSRGAPVFSFEFFPPRTEKGFDSLFRTVAELKRLDPGFVSVTWGAGGSTRRHTVELVLRIQREAGLTAMAHLTCVGSTREEIADTLDELSAGGIQNVLPLRGDPPRDQPDFRPLPGGFRFASELLEFIHAGWDFCTPAACHPEVHPDAASPEADLANLARKVAAGASFLITQLFFDNEVYFRFAERARAAGIRVPILPGVMPITSGSNIERIIEMSKTRMPSELTAALRATGGDPDRLDALGVEWGTAQCRELLTRGAPGIHFYTLNRSPATRRIHEALFPR
jgi:methylenetetrahydrofolate reductase (NADPH)